MMDSGGSGSGCGVVVVGGMVMKVAIMTVELAVDIAISMIIMKQLLDDYVC